jgi:hypothetical protein
MKCFVHQLKNAAGIVASLALLSGCAINMKVPVKDPAPSTLAYKKAEAVAPVSLSFKDNQTAEDKAKLLSGLIPMQMVYNDKAFDAVPWIVQQTMKEMTTRGLPVTLVDEGKGGASVLIKRVHIENHRASAFSPFVTFTSLQADVMTARGPQRITSYVKRGKVPVMTFDEVIDPTYNDALGVLTKEFAAKLNQQLFRQEIGNDQVKALIGKINQDGGKADNAYLEVYQLGFGNNMTAVPELVKLSSHVNEYVRLAAISSLGILKATDQMGFLTRLYETPGLIWQDRAMALKAIGDMDTPESRAYLQKQKAQFGSRTDKESAWTKEIIGLYL